METLKIIKIRENNSLIKAATHWFHKKWGIEETEYRDSMESCISGSGPVPQWYIVSDGKDIVAGAGVIENDFHERSDLAPNVCALFVEEPYRCRGIAGRLLRFICADFEVMGIDTLYLITEHTCFYERYGWKFLCTAPWTGEPGEGRVYVYKSR